MAAPSLAAVAAGMESRRVYVLEHAGEFVRSHALKPEDVIGISTTLEGAFLIEYNTDEVCNAAETQAAARPGQVRAGGVRRLRSRQWVLGCCQRWTAAQDLPANS